MKGLLIKDFRLILSRNSNIILLAGVIIFISIFMDDPDFLIGYMAMICALMSLSTISYDEYDNGYAFLMTLPVTRKMYVQSKYVLSVVYSVLIWLFATVLSTVVAAVKGATIDMSAVTGMCMASLLFLAIMIPLDFKYGAEKARIMLLFIIAIVAAVSASIIILLAKSNVFPEDYDDILYNNMVQNKALIAMGIVAIGLILTGISYFISVKIIEKKEF